MVTEVCLSIIAIAMLILCIALIKISSRAQQAICLLQTDIHALSIEATHLINSMNDFVNTDLHKVSQETSSLINQLSLLSSDISHKANSLNFLFQPFRFLNSKLNSDSSSDEQFSKRKTILQFTKWIVSSLTLLTTIKEFVKKHERRTS